MTYDLIIIGAGPAGVSAAVYAARQKLNMLIISKDVGGQVAKKAVDIENYPGFGKISGPELTDLFSEQLKKNKVEIVLDEVLKIEKVYPHTNLGDDGGNTTSKSEAARPHTKVSAETSGVGTSPATGGISNPIGKIGVGAGKFIISTSQSKKYEASAIIIATGADPRPLEVPGEKEFIGKGVSYCALCDGPVFGGKTVAVVGGGNSGFETALFLSNYVKKIYILEFNDSLKADEENQELIKKKGKSEIITSAKVLKIEGGPMVKSLTYEKMNEPASAKGSGEAREKKLDVEGIFVEVGYSPSTAFAKDLVDFSDKDEILTETETYQTKTPGLFAVGDCNEGKYKQIVTAAGEGAKAALAAYEYLQRKH
ncbi:MAG: FAD-dependent oxidoreductase [bacterium]